MNWLKKLFSGSARRADTPASPAPASTMVPDYAPTRVSGESIDTYITRMELEARRTGNARLRSRARHLRLIHTR
jgi:hypothetical protein